MEKHSWEFFFAGQCIEPQPVGSGGESPRLAANNKLDQEDNVDETHG